MPRVLVVTLCRDFTVLVHLYHAQNDLLEVLDVDFFFGVVIIGILHCEELLAFEVLSGHVLESGPTPVAKLDDRGRVH